jgi:hypothetical protein
MTVQRLLRKIEATAAIKDLIQKTGLNWRQFVWASLMSMLEERIPRVKEQDVEEAIISMWRSGKAVITKTDGSQLHAFVYNGSDPDGRFFRSSSFNIVLTEA